MNNESFNPVPIEHKYFTKGVNILLLIALNGIIFLLIRFIYGIGAVTNLNNQYPWGLWIGVDVAAGVALAAGGFTTAAITYIMQKNEYHTVVRSALLTAMLGYTFVALAVLIDNGRWYYIWHPLVMWNGNSALFEVGICVMIYLSVLYVEAIPIFTERFIGKVNLPFMLSKFNKVTDKFLRFIDKQFSKMMFIFIIAGVVLSTLHQSSLGTLMIISGEKIHPLWQTPISPLLFLLSAISVGLPMVIFESLIASRSFGLKPEMEVLSKLGYMVSPLLGIHLAFKIGDMFIRETFIYLNEINIVSIMFSIEVLFGIIIPLRMFLSPKVLKSKLLLFIASTFVIFGVLLNRINNFITAYTPPYSEKAYFPSIGEFSVTFGFIAILILVYRFVVLNFPVISSPEKKNEYRAKYSIKFGK